MTQFGLTVEQVRLREAARRFARGMLFEAGAQAEKTHADCPQAILKEMAAHGFLGLDVPAEYGGRGFDTVTCGVILEELAAVVFARSSRDAPRGKNISIILVDKGTEGLAIGQRFETKEGS